MVWWCQRPVYKHIYRERYDIPDLLNDKIKFCLWNDNEERRQTTISVINIHIYSTMQCVMATKHNNNSRTKTT